MFPWSKAESCEELELQKVEAKMEATRGVKQSTCGGEAGWYREEEGEVRRACMSKRAFEAARGSEKVGGTFPGRRTRQRGDVNEVIFPTKALRV